MTAHQPLRLLHLYAGNLYGGIETLLSTIASSRDLSPELESSFGLCFKGRLWEELRQSNAEVHHFGDVRWRQPWTVLRARNLLLKVLKSNRFDAIATHANWPHAVFAPAAKKARIPIINFVHDAFRSLTWIDRLAGLTKPNVVIANSNYSQSFVSRVFPNVRSEVVYYPVRKKSVSCHTRTSVRCELSTHENSTVFIQVSRLEPWKGADRTLTALGRMKDNLGWTAWFVGGAQRPKELDYEQHLLRLANELGIAHRVRFLGERNDVSRLLSAADVFCQPNSFPEPFGIVFIEALQAGCAIVTSNVGGASEIVNSSCGGHCSIDSIESLVHVLTSYLIPSNRPNPADCVFRSASLCDARSQLNKYRNLLTDITLKHEMRHKSN